MKRKFYSIFSITLLSILSLNAKQLTLDESFSLYKKSHPETRTSIEPVLVKTVKAFDNKDFAGVYVFNLNTGFVILSADDSFYAVLGYGDGEFDASEEMPPALREMLQGYADFIYFKSNSESPDQDYSFSIPEASTWTSIEPLITAKWGQQQPYNSQIAPGKRYPVGCVSLSMGQVMRYHQWPPMGKGAISYRIVGNDIYSGQISVDFSELKFDWENMPNALANSSPSQQIDAVATLLKATGASVYMSYSPSVSLAYSQLEPPSIYKYFDYSELMRHVEADYYSPGEWTWMVYNQISQGIPLIYGGTGGYGHSFICDGFEYDDDKPYFHFNWGWKGTDNGYYLLNNLYPSSNYNSGPFNKNIEMLINMVKPGTEINNIEKDPLFYLRGNLYVWNTEAVALGAPINFFQNNYGLRNAGATEVTGKPGFLLVNNETGRRYFSYDSSDRTIGVPEFVGNDQSGFRYDVNTSGRVKIILPESMEEGRYTAVPIFKPEGSTTFIRVLCPIHLPSSLTVEVNENKATFSENSIVRLNAYDISYETSSEKDEAVEISCRVYNPADINKETSLGVRLVDNSGIVVANIKASVNISLEPGAETNVTFAGIIESIEPLKPSCYSIDIYDLETGIPLGLTSVNDPIYNPDPAGVDSVNKEELDINIYPNPADSYVTVESQNPIRNIMIYDLSGRLLKQISGNCSNACNVNVNNLSSGLYILAVQLEKGIIERRRIIIR